MPPRQGVSILTTGVPFMVFLLGSWYGLAQLVDSKRKLRNSSRGLDNVEELDPLERMRRRYNLDQQGQAQVSPPRMSTLEEELEDVKRKVNIYDFDYKPVPRTADEE